MGIKTYGGNPVFQYARDNPPSDRLTSDDETESTTSSAAYKSAEDTPLSPLCTGGRLKNIPRPSTEDIVESLGRDLKLERRTNAQLRKQLGDSERALVQEKQDHLATSQKLARTEAKLKQQENVSRAAVHEMHQMQEELQGLSILVEESRNKVEDLQGLYIEQQSEVAHLRSLVLQPEDASIASMDTDNEEDNTPSDPGLSHAHESPIDRGNRATPQFNPKPRAPVAHNVGRCRKDGGDHDWTTHGSNGCVRKYLCVNCGIDVQEKPDKDQESGWSPYVPKKGKKKK